MTAARQVKVADLRPGMVTTYWIVVGEPFAGRVEEGGDELVTVVRMRHRVDGGETDVYFDLGHEVTVIEEVLE